MYKILTEADKIEKKEWSTFVDNHINGNFYQSPDFYDFMSATPGADPFVISIKYKSNLIAILVGVHFYSTGLLKVFTQRAIVFGGPLIAQNHVEDVLPIVLEHIQKKVNAIYIEFRNLFQVSKPEIFENTGYKYQPYLNYIIDLSAGSQKIFENLKSEKRRQIRKAVKHGVKIEIAQNLEEVKDLYQIFESLYMEKVKKPLPTYSFFKNFYLKLQRNNAGVVLVLKKDNRIIGGSFNPLYKNRIIYDWYRAGDDKNYKKCYPSTLAAWAGIDYGLTKGYKVFDFMGAGRKDEMYGVRDFKSQFNGELVEYGRYLKVTKPFFYKIGKTGINFLTKRKK